MINDKYIDELSNTYKQSYLEYMKGVYYTERWGSHQPVLIHALNTIVVGNVLEFGMGYNSTPIMHLICEKQNRKLLSMDSSEEWFNKFIQYKNDNHEMFVFTTDKILNKEYDFFNKKYSIVFVDAAPAWIRQKFIQLIKENTDYIIVHDTEDKINYFYDFSSFKHVFCFNKVSVFTSILSNLDDIDENLVKIFK